MIRNFFLSLITIFTIGFHLNVQAQCPNLISEGCGGGGYQWNFSATANQVITDLFVISPPGACVLTENFPGDYTLTCFDPDPATSDPLYPLCVILPPCDLSTTATVDGIGECTGLIAAFDCAGDGCDTQAGGCTQPCNNVNLNIMFDSFPGQSSWDIVDGNNTIVASGGPYGSSSPYSTTTESSCLPDGCYTLNFYDSLSNGMCPFTVALGSSATFITPGTLIAPGTIVGTLSLFIAPQLCGSYMLTDASSTIILSGGGIFPAMQSTAFCVP